MVRRECCLGFASENEMLAAAALRKEKDGEHTVTSAGTNFVKGFTNNSKWAYVLMAW